MEELDGDDVERPWFRKYRVTTVVPHCDRPKMNVHIFDQEDLDNFLQGYDEFGEFIVSVVPLHPDPEQQPFTCQVKSPVDV